MNNENKYIVIGENDSYYDGGYWSFIFRNFGLLVGTLFTFGIAYPWLRCWYQRWLCSHTVISGKRMRFDGQGRDLFSKYILWLVLTYITCGIYGFWRDVSLKKWVSEHTHFENEPDNNSFFDGKVGDYFVAVILAFLAAFVPLIGIAWSRVIIARWFVNHTVCDNRRLTFNGTVGDLFVRYLLWGVLTSVTCGIFILLVPVKYIKWETEYTLDTDFTPEAVNNQANYKTKIYTDAVMLKGRDDEKIADIKAEMNLVGKHGLEIGEGDAAVEKLESAVHLSDMLKAANVPLSDEESALIYSCKAVIRKIKAEKPYVTKSKAWVVVVAAIVALLLFVGTVIGGITLAVKYIPKAVNSVKSINAEQLEEFLPSYIYDKIFKS